jgi:hypothetical protein
MKREDIRKEIMDVRKILDRIIRDIDAKNDIKIVVYEHLSTVLPDTNISILMVDKRGAVSYNHWIHSPNDHSGSARCLYQLARDLNPLDVEREEPFIEYYSNVYMKDVGAEKGGPEGVYFINGLTKLTQLKYYAIPQLPDDDLTKLKKYIEGVENGIKNSMSEGDQGTSGDSTKDLSEAEDKQLRSA